VDTAITTCGVVWEVSIVCENCGPVFTQGMPVENIRRTRGLLDKCQCRRCGGRLLLLSATGHRDLRRGRRAPRQ